MAIFDFLKDKPESDKTLGKTKAKKTAVKKEANKAEKPKAEAAPKTAKAHVIHGGSSLVSPHVTEKAAILGEKNKYVFKVAKDSNKTEIKRAVEKNYGVSVISVKIINAPGKERRVGRHIGWKKGHKKAIIRIKGGQTIEVAPR